MFFRNKIHVLLLLWVALTLTSPAQTFTKLLDFNGGNGALPYYMSLLQGTSGSLYGTDTTGGASGTYGTVFKITVGGSLTTLHSFSNSSDGASPAATLLQASDGNFYGADGAGPDGGGTVFKITPAGTLTTLHSFLCNQSSCPEGGGPSAVIQGRDGNFYGTTSAGGPHGGGTVFRITPTGTLTTLYSFCSLAYCVDGRNAVNTLVQGRDGNFYGTAAGGWE